MPTLGTATDWLAVPSSFGANRRLQSAAVSRSRRTSVLSSPETHDSVLGSEPLSRGTFGRANVWLSRRFGSRRQVRSARGAGAVAVHARAREWCGRPSLPGFPGTGRGNHVILSHIAPVPRAERARHDASSAPPRTWQIGQPAVEPADGPRVLIPPHFGMAACPPQARVTSDNAIHGPSTCAATTSSPSGARATRARPSATTTTTGTTRRRSLSVLDE